MYIYYFAVAATVLMVSKDYQFSSDFVSLWVVLSHCTVLKRKRTAFCQILLYHFRFRWILLCFAYWYSVFYVCYYFLSVAVSAVFQPYCTSFVM